ncbi:MAG: RagB/SusD family nutrient uptake outer membrane protein [Niabella sp.]
MKKLLYILGVAALFTTVSCGKYLDQIPDNILTADDIWKSKNRTENFLANIYSAIPNELAQRFVNNGNSGPWNAASDESKYTWDFNYANNLNSSVWANTNSQVAHYWREYYRAIRNATYFIQNADRTDPSEIEPTLITRYKAEARALRAYYYFQLIRIYGPVVILGEDLLDFEADISTLKLPRNSFDECVDYIVSEFDIAYNDLPVVPQQIREGGAGRITKGMVKAYKAETLLLAASPLFNGNRDYADLKNTDGKQLISQTYDLNKWKIAADAHKAFIDEFVPGVYDLYVQTNSDLFMQGYLSTRYVMTEEWNKEWIFGRTISGNNMEYDRRPKHVGFASSVQGGGAHGVTQTMVDAYFMANGKPITDPESEYVATGFSNFKAPFDTKARSTFNQWTGREPRFYVGVTYNRSFWLNQPSSTEVITIMEYNGNSGRIQSLSDVTPTGYIVRKSIIGTSSDRSFSLLRLANIYLNYAEALNEYDPTNADILKYVNLIRKRAGIPEYGSAELAAPTGQEALREAIRMERRVELAFESVRYFDTRRWKIAEQTNSGNFYGMNLQANGDAFYEKTLLEVRKFLPRDYLWPIPNNEVLKNDLLKQNTGW